MKREGLKIGSDSVSISTAILAEYIGFNLHCNLSVDLLQKEFIGYCDGLGIDNTFRSGSMMLVEVPEQSLLQKWLRDAHDINIETSYERDDEGLMWEISFVDMHLVEQFYYDESYEEALSACLKGALSLINSHADELIDDIK
jgi:hypothetical protein